MYPIETAIINACHSGQGGTGDVAILTAANRMQLMPFAQIATRIGGAITVTAVLIMLTRLVWQASTDMNITGNALRKGALPLGRASPQQR
jgi:hypothetical protein